MKYLLLAFKGVKDLYHLQGGKFIGFCNTVIDSITVMRHYRSFLVSSSKVVTMSFILSCKRFGYDFAGYEVAEDFNPFMSGLSHQLQKVTLKIYLLELN